MRVGDATREATSPELVLVDGTFALRARDRLPTPDDTVARIEREIALRRLVARQLLEPQLGAPEATLERSLLDRALPPMRRRPTLLVAATTAGALAAALLLGVQVDLRGTPAVAESVVEDSPDPVVDKADPGVGTKKSPAIRTPEAEPSTRSTRYQPIEPSPRQSRPFAWAPVPGASGYRVEFFRGSERIFSRDTARPQLELPRKWRFSGRIQTLRPGVYRWYVWPVQDDRRAPRATVQAELIVD
jgi:hypothetical protein